MIGLIAIGTTILAAISDTDRKKQATVAFALGGFQGMVDAGHLDVAEKMMVHKMQSAPNWPYAVDGKRSGRDEIERMRHITNIAMKDNDLFSLRYMVFEHGLHLIKTEGYASRYIFGSSPKGSELLRLWPAPGWTVEPRQDLYVSYISDDTYMVGAFGDLESALQSEKRMTHRRDDMNLYKVRGVPFTLAERLRKQGTGMDFFNNGNVAMNELSSYPSEQLVGADP